MNDSRIVRRILMTGDAVGGVWTFCLDLARALGAHGIDVSLAVMGAGPRGERRADAAAIENLRLFSRPFRLEWMKDPWRDLAASTEWLLDLEARVAPDAIHLNSYGQGAAAWRAPVVLTGHSCVLSWWRAVHRAAAPEEWSRYAGLVAAALARADVVTAPSRDMLSALEANYGPIPRGRVIANGRDPSRFFSLPKEPFVLGAGRLWDRGKNIETLAEAAEGIEWPVYLAGQARGPGGERWQAANCRMLGALGSAILAEWYARAAIYAHPARYEPFGLSVLEAALSGCALALADIPSLRENWDGAAEFFPPGDPWAWKRGLRSMIADPDRWRALGRLARRRGIEFTAERTAAGYADCYALAVARAEGACAS